MAMYNCNEALICTTPPKKKGAARDYSLRSLSKYADGLDCLTENSENGSPNVPSSSPTPTGTRTPFQMLDDTPTGTRTPFQMLDDMSDSQLRSSCLMDIDEDVNEQNVKEQNRFSHLASPTVLFDIQSFVKVNVPMSPQHMKQVHKKKKKKSKTTSATSIIGTTTWYNNDTYSSKRCL